MRYTGKHCVFYLGGVKVADGYDATVKVGTKMMDGDAWGDEWELPEPDIGNWNATVKRYHTSGAATLLAKADDTPSAATPLRMILYAYEGVTASRIFEGDCWVEDAEGSFAKGALISESATIRGYGAPIYAGGY